MHYVAVIDKGADSAYEHAARALPALRPGTRRRGRISSLCSKLSTPLDIQVKRASISAAALPRGANSGAALRGPR